MFHQGVGSGEAHGCGVVHACAEVIEVQSARGDVFLSRELIGLLVGDFAVGVRHKHTVGVIVIGLHEVAVTHHRPDIALPVGDVIMVDIFRAGGSDVAAGEEYAFELRAFEDEIVVIGAREEVDIGNGEVTVDFSAVDFSAVGYSDGAFSQRIYAEFRPGAHREFAPESVVGERDVATVAEVDGHREVETVVGDGDNALARVGDEIAVSVPCVLAAAGGEIIGTKGNMSIAFFQKGVRSD